MGKVNHNMVPVQVWADVDEGIVDAVVYLNSIPGVRTYGSCQGSIGEGGPHPYEPYVLAWWPEVARGRIEARFNLGERGENWTYLHPKARG